VTVLFHTTDAADAILREGFRPSDGSFGLASGAFSGVFLSRTPANISDGAHGDQVLRVIFPDDFDLTPFAVHSAGGPVWEWCVPADDVNSHADVVLLSQEEADAIA